MLYRVCVVIYMNVVFCRGLYRGPDTGILAEIASLQVEYTYLAKLTGRKEHFNRVGFLALLLKEIII